MIVIVKAPNYKKIVFQLLSIGALGGAGGWYYYDTHKEVSAPKEQHAVHTQKDDKKEKRAKELESIIYNEAEVVVYLINQVKVWDLKIVKDRLFIECSSDTDLEQLMIRYVAMELVKNTSTNIKIAIDLSYLVESK